MCALWAHQKDGVVGRTVRPGLSPHATLASNGPAHALPQKGDPLSLPTGTRASMSRHCRRHTRAHTSCRRAWSHRRALLRDHRPIVWPLLCCQPLAAPAGSPCQFNYAAHTKACRRARIPPCERPGTCPTTALVSNWPTVCCSRSTISTTGSTRTDARGTRRRAPSPPATTLWQAAPRKRSVILLTVSHIRLYFNCLGASVFV